MRLLLALLLTTNVYADSLFTTKEQLTKTIKVDSGACIKNYCYMGTKQIFRVNIGPVQVGDFFSFNSIQEYTAEFYSPSLNAQWISVPSVVIASTHADSINGALDIATPHPWDFQVDEIQGDNIALQAQHHHAVVKVGDFIVTQEMKNQWGASDVYIIVLAWAVSTNYYAMRNAPVLVQEGQGHLNVVKH